MERAVGFLHHRCYSGGFGLLAQFYRPHLCRDNLWLIPSTSIHTIVALTGPCSCLIKAVMSYEMRLRRLHATMMEIDHESATLPGLPERRVDARIVDQQLQPSLFSTEPVQRSHRSMCRMPG